MLFQSSMGKTLLGIFATCFLLATILALALGFDLLVPTPDIPETLDFPGRLQALQPFRDAQWPFDAVSTLLFVVGFGALALVAGPIASLAGADRRAGVLGVGMSALVLGDRGLPQMWRWISWSAAGLLILSIALHEVSDTPAGDLIASVASGLLLPAWAVILAMRSDQIDPLSEAYRSA